MTMTPTCDECLKAIDRNTEAVKIMSRHVSTLARQVAILNANLSSLVQDKKEMHQEIGMLKQRLERISDLFPSVGALEPEPSGG